MTTSVLRPLLALALAGAASAAAAQAPAPASADSAAAPAVNDQAAQDRIMAMVRSGKCGSAKAEATRVGDLSLADQIGTMCGAHSSDPFAKGKGSGHGAGGGGQGRIGRGG